MTFSPRTRIGCYEIVGDLGRGRNGGGYRARNTRLEMPRIDERFAGLSYRQGWYLANTRNEDPMDFNAIAHIDLKSGKRALRILDPGDVAGEPLFVPRSGSAPEATAMSSR